MHSIVKDRSVIAVDIDDVLADSARGFIEFSNERWDTNLVVADYDEHWAAMWRVDEKEAERRAWEFHTSSAVASYHHDKAALLVLQRIAERFDLIILTSRRLQIEKETLVWIEQHYPKVFKAVNFADIWDTFSEQSRHQTKAELCQALGADYLIDDQIKHCEAAAACGVKSLLFGDYNWNRADKLPEGVMRVKNWERVGEYFDGRAS